MYTYTCTSKFTCIHIFHSTKFKTLLNHSVYFCTCSTQNLHCVASWHGFHQLTTCPKTKTVTMYCNLAYTVQCVASCHWLHTLYLLWDVDGTCISHCSWTIPPLYWAMARLFHPNCMLYVHVHVPVFLSTTEQPVNYISRSGKDGCCWESNCTCNLKVTNVCLAVTTCKFSEFTNATKKMQIQVFAKFKNCFDLSVENTKIPTGNSVVKIKKVHEHCTWSLNLGKEKSLNWLVHVHCIL